MQLKIWGAGVQELQDEKLRCGKIKLIFIEVQKAELGIIDHAEVPAPISATPELLPQCRINGGCGNSAARTSRDPTEVAHEVHK